MTDMTLLEKIIRTIEEIPDDVYHYTDKYYKEEIIKVLLKKYGKRGKGSHKSKRMAKESLER